MMTGASDKERAQAARELKMVLAKHPAGDHGIVDAAMWWIQGCQACGFLGTMLDDKVALHRSLTQAGP